MRRNNSPFLLARNSCKTLAQGFYALKLRVEYNAMIHLRLILHIPLAYLTAMGKVLKSEEEAKVN